MGEFGSELTHLVAMTSERTMCQVKVFGALSEVYCGLIVFNLDMKKAARTIRINPGGTIYNRLAQHMAYADD